MITARRRVGIERVRGNCRIMSLSQTSWSPIKYVEVFIGIEDARSILLSTERSDIKTVSVPLSCIFQRSRINVDQLAGSFLFTEMPHLWQRASFDRPWWRCCSEGGILHNWRRWEGQYNKSYPSVCYSCKLTAAPFKVVFLCAKLQLNYAPQDAKTLYSVCQTRLDCSDGSQMSHKWSKLKSTEPLHRM